MQLRQGDAIPSIHIYILYLCISPGASGFNLEKNVESWNFQEGYLNTH